MHLQNRVALVTGASRGIGASIVQQLQAAGCQVAFTARHAEPLHALARPQDLPIAGDLLDEAFRQHLVTQTVARYGRIDLLINNAGVGQYQRSIEAESAEIRSLWEINFFAPLELARLVVPQMLGQERLADANECGMVVNVSSVAGRVTLPWFSMYSASKFALSSWTRGLRMEYLGKGLRTLEVCPGYVKTEFQASALSGKPPAALAASKDRFAITPDACAKAILQGIRKNRRTVMTPASSWALVLASQLFPGIVERRMAGINGTD